MKKIISGLLALTMMMALTACASSTTTGSDEEKPVLVVGTSADYPPYEFHVLIDGVDTIAGFDIALAQAIADDMGYELEIVDMSFNLLMGELNTGSVDMVIAGLSPDEDRDATFSDIYYEATQAVIVSSDMLDTYVDIASLAGKQVGAQTGSIQEGLVNDYMPDVTLVSLTKIPNLVSELISGKVDALVMEVPVAEGYIEANEGIAIAFEVEDDAGGSAVAVKTGNTELIEKVNETIARLIESGEFDVFVQEATELASEA